MGRESVFGGAGAILVAAMGGDDMQYTHVATGETITVNGFEKNVEKYVEQRNGGVQQQLLPFFRVVGITWDEDDLVGDTLVDTKGRTWAVQAGAARPSGIMNLYVDLRG